IFALSLLAIPLPLLTPLPMKIVVDALSGGPPVPAFLQPLVPESITGSTTALFAFAAGLFVVLGIVQQVHTIGMTLLTVYTGEKLVLNLRADLFRHVQRLSSSYHDTKGTGDTAYRIQYDAYCLKSILLDGAIPMVTMVCSFVLTVYIAARIDWQLVLLLVAVAPASAWLTQVFRVRFRRQWTEVRSL